MKNMQMRLNPSLVEVWYWLTGRSYKHQKHHPIDGLDHFDPWPERLSYMIGAICSARFSGMFIDDRPFWGWYLTLMTGVFVIAFIWRKVLPPDKAPDHWNSSAGPRIMIGFCSVIMLAVAGSIVLSFGLLWFLCLGISLLAVVWTLFDIKKLV